MQKIPILAYHKISPKFELGLTTISPKKFYKQMRYLKKKGMVGCSLKEYLQNPAENKFVITFDDAYENIFEFVFPFLQSIGFTASIFVIVNYIGKENTWDANLGGIKFKHADKIQLEIMKDNNWEICSHSMNHIALGNLTEKKIKDEVKKSKLELEKMFDIEVNSFGFPFGYYNKKLIKILKEYGYKNGVGFTENFKNDIPVYGRMGVYKLIDWKVSPYIKINQKHFLHYFELLKGKLIHLGSYLTVLYQKIISK
ncbi:MAG: polysaccharide deacetylase family protein [Candidatus Marinimicrobia bacterium]|nr:polysaccharide deacetylase family protein [Candidatus Neomarinimicrobiota bacterium]